MCVLIFQTLSYYLYQYLKLKNENENYDVFNHFLEDLRENKFFNMCISIFARSVCYDTAVTFFKKVKYSNQPNYLPEKNRNNIKKSIAYMLNKIVNQNIKIREVGKPKQKDTDSKYSDIIIEWVESEKNY